MEVRDADAHVTGYESHTLAHVPKQVPGFRPRVISYESKNNNWSEKTVGVKSDDVVEELRKRGYSTLQLRSARSVPRCTTTPHKATIHTYYRMSSKPSIKGW